ncbi:membrane protein FxsA [Paenibacillus sp. GSMTC-2017]|uniref:FxsA family protein n=1 Tax=Paenibacillus sp. GSMTC-2017 TaxID=2794350 RepID=UPI0018D6F02E|nr:FxsA family protein [Paenibacillus sp. GSMTC-2017]MBH5317234.1 membrane protein FxsA [Paenibacillus sp. GSMTC-2017]
MYKWLLAAFLIIPVIELWGILQVGDWIGGWNTFLIIIVMSALGAYLARSEGRKVWMEAQLQMQAGQMPGRALIDGICVLLGGLLLLTPGFFSDLIGIVMLLPITRPFIRHMVLQWLEKRMRNGNFTIKRF